MALSHTPFGRVGSALTPPPRGRRGHTPLVHEAPLHAGKRLVRARPIAASAPRWWGRCGGGEGRGQRLAPGQGSYRGLGVTEGAYRDHLGSHGWGQTWVKAHPVSGGGGTHRSGITSGSHRGSLGVTQGSGVTQGLGSGGGYLRSSWAPSRSCRRYPTPRRAPGGALRCRSSRRSTSRCRDRRTTPSSAWRPAGSEVGGHQGFEGDPPTLRAGDSCGRSQRAGEPIEGQGAGHDPQTWGAQGALGVLGPRGGRGSSRTTDEGPDKAPDPRHRQPPAPGVAHGQHPSGHQLPGEGTQGRCWGAGSMVGVAGPTLGVPAWPHAAPGGPQLPGGPKPSSGSSAATPAPPWGPRPPRPPSPAARPSRT